MGFEGSGHAGSRNRVRSVIFALLLMILINIAVRYPYDQAAPHGSDTYFTLDLARSLEQNGRAGWILTPFSYVGLYPLSYPSGIVFEISEVRLLSGANWNTMPLIFSMFFTVLLILSGFMLFRAFRMADELAAIFSGLMALSPFFLFFTDSHASTRGYLVPIFIFGLFVVFWKEGNVRRRFLLFGLLSFCALTIHRSSLAVLMFEGLAGIVLFVSPYLASMSRRTRSLTYLSAMFVGIVLILAPFISPVRDFFESIPDLVISYRIAEWEFRTGYLLSGEGPIVLLVNLVTNYIGSMGLVLLLLPAVVLTFYPSSRESRERDMFLVAVLIVFAPFVWKAQYIQLMLLPFIYMAAGLSLQRFNRIAMVFSRMLSIVSVRLPRPRIQRDLRQTALLAFVFSCVVFSVIWHAHRSNMLDEPTGQMNWPSDSQINTGIYVGSLEHGSADAFVSNSGLLDRRIKWYSNWNCPTGDPASLLTAGYLTATPDDFEPKPGMRGDYLGFLMTFYKLDRVYVLNSSVESYELYMLSWTDSFGFLRLYFTNVSSPAFSPPVSTNEAKISLVVEMITLGDRIRNPYTLEGTYPSRFLTEISTETYVIHVNEELRVNLAAAPIWDW